MEYIYTAISALCLLGIFIIIVMLAKNKGKGGNAPTNTAALEKRIEAVRGELIGSIGLVNKTVNEAITHNFATLQGNLNALMQAEKEGNAQANALIKEFLSSLKADIEKRLNEMNEQNAKKLEEVRKTVDEKLTKSLEERVKLAFSDINTRLVEMQKGFSEVQSLSKQVTKLNGVFTNVKTRGTWGEVTLENILFEILPPDVYEKQARVFKGREVVDFAVKLPGGDSSVLLPIDAKFPTADYERLSEAYASGDKEIAVNARKRLLISVKEQAKSISSKYICPPETTNFAIMYLPTEGLFAEVAREPGFMDELRVNYRIIPCGPTTVAALLNSLTVGFTTLRIQKKSAEVVKLMKVLAVDFEKFTVLIEKIRKNNGSIAEAIDGLDKRSELIRKRIGRLDLNAIDGDGEEKLIGGEE